MVHFDTAFLRWPGKSSHNTRQVSAPHLSRKRDLFLAFAIVSVPLLVIAILLLTFVLGSQRENPATYEEIPELPFLNNYSTDAFYTSVDAGSFLLLGSWASNFATIVVAPFMLLFSYAVAREILQHAKHDHEDTSVRPPLLREIMRGAHVGVWHWVGEIFYKKSKKPFGKGPILRVVDFAGLGLFTATLLTIMVIVGDNWLHVTTQNFQITHYDDSTNYTENKDPRVDFYQAGFSINDSCQAQLATVLPQDVSTAPPPCSLNMTEGFTNVADPYDVYLTLGTGISQVSSGFNSINYTNTADREEKGTATSFQVVTYPPNANVSHSLLFCPDAAAEVDYTAIGLGTHYGIDYVANSTSMVTQCTFATQECNVGAGSTNSTDGNNISIPFDCYPDFAGNLGQTPLTGHERAQGWNMSFYQLVNGTPTNIPFQAQSNPFHFYVVTAVNSISLPDFDSESTLPEGNPRNHSLVDVGQGFTAFALNCEATIYDITFTIINGSFWDQGFSFSKSSPQKANIVQAPLQVGFGQYHLYQAASLAVLANNDSVAVSMARVFSQTGMALASGVFNLDSNIYQRFRWNKSVTRVPKAPLFYLVTLCLLYSVFGMVMAVLALYLRRMPEVRDQQVRLMVEWAPELREMEMEQAGNGEEKGIGGERREGERLRKISSDITDVFG